MGIFVGISAFASARISPIVQQSLNPNGVHINGAGIVNGGMLSLSNCTISANHATVPVSIADQAFARSAHGSPWSARVYHHGCTAKFTWATSWCCGP